MYPCDVENIFHKTLPRIYMKEKTSFVSSCSLIFSKSWIFIVWKRFFVGYRKIDKLKWKKVGTALICSFCVEFRRFYTTLVPVSRKNVLFLTSIVEIKHVVFWCVEHFFCFLRFSFAYLLYNNTVYRILNRCIENWQ